MRPQLGSKRIQIRRNPKGAWVLRAISALLVVNMAIPSGPFFSNQILHRLHEK
jgi:hypothetical protein